MKAAGDIGTDVMASVEETFVGCGATLSADGRERGEGGRGWSARGREMEGLWSRGEEEDEEEEEEDGCGSCLDFPFPY